MAENFYNAFEGGRADARKTAAYNALRAAYGDIAGDPETASRLQTYSQNEQAFPLVQRSRELSNSGAEQSQAQSAALHPGAVAAQGTANARNEQKLADEQQTARDKALLNGAYFIQNAVSRGVVDAAAAFDQIAPNLRLPPEQAAAVRAAIAKDPKVVNSFIEALSKKLNDSNRFQFFQDPSGKVFRAGAEGGAEAVNGPDGQPLVGYQAPIAQERIAQGDRRLGQQLELAQPEFKGNVAEAQAEGKVAGTTAANLPTFEAVLAHARERINEVRSDPALDAIFGSPTLKKMLTNGGFGAFGAIPGTPAADAAANVKALVSQLRSQAYETLKGGGAITENESKFASEALANLERAQSKQSFMRELDNLNSVLDRAEKAIKERARKPAGAAPPGGAPEQPQERDGDPLGLFN